MSIVDYLRFSAEIQGVPREDIPGRIGEMIDLCGLNEKNTRILMNCPKASGKEWDLLKR